MKKIYSAPQITKIREVKHTCIICTSAPPLKLVNDGEASDNTDATLSKTINFSGDISGEEGE